MNVKYILFYICNFIPGLVLELKCELIMYDVLYFIFYFYFKNLFNHISVLNGWASFHNLYIWCFNWVLQYSAILIQEIHYPTSVLEGNLQYHWWQLISIVSTGVIYCIFHITTHCWTANKSNHEAIKRAKKENYKVLQIIKLFYPISAMKDKTIVITGEKRI